MKEGQACLQSRVKVVNSQTQGPLCGDSLGQSPPCDGTLRPLICSRCLPAVTVDEPIRRLLLWREQRLLLRPSTGSSQGRWDSQATVRGGRLPDSSCDEQGWAPLGEPILSFRTDSKDLGIWGRVILRKKSFWYVKLWQTEEGMGIQMLTLHGVDLKLKRGLQLSGLIQD